MSLYRFRALFLVSTAVLALFVASPVLEKLVYFPQTTFFTEFSLFGSYNNATYPSNVTSGQTLRLYLNIENQLGSCGYYVVEPKFSNQTSDLPNSFNFTSSKLPSLGDVTCFVADNQTVKLPIDVSFQYNISKNNPRLLDVQNITINGETIALTPPTTVALEPDSSGFFGNLFFELWIYNGTTNAFVYHERYVSLWLKMLT